MKKDLLVVSIIIFLIILLFSGTEIQSVDEYYLIHLDDITEDSPTVFLMITCETILDNYDMLNPALRSDKYVPSDGVILEKTEYVLRPNDTVFDIFSRAIRNKQIHMEYSYNQVFKSIYIEGINHLYEFSCGPLSGWMYKVNDVFPDYGVSLYYLEDGDFIHIVYTCDLGRDVESDWYK